MTHLVMDVQDFLVQGEGREEDKREAWQLFQKAYELQMKANWRKPFRFTGNRWPRIRPPKLTRFSVGPTVSWDG